MNKNIIEIVTDTSFTHKSNYNWVNIIKDMCRVGKCRTKIINECLIINSIQIYSQFRGKGIGKEFVTKCKNEYSVIIADRVRKNAIMFWEKMGFQKMKDGNYKYETIN